MGRSSPSSQGSPTGWIISIGLGLASIAIVVLWPELPVQRAKARQLLFVILGIVAAVPILAAILPLSAERRRTWRDISVIANVSIIVWQVLVGRTTLLPSYVFPSPARVFSAIQNDIGLLGKGTFSSLRLLVAGLGLSILTAIPLGLAIGWYRRLSLTILPIAKVIAPTPPTVYVPYAIALLPSFFAASVLVIYAGTFWSVLINTIRAVELIDRKILDSARTLCLKPWKFFVSVLLPGAAPGIFTGITMGLISSFIMLTIAEMIGATSGLGWYVQYFADLSQYDRVVAGILYISFVVFIIIAAYERLQRYALRWRGQDQN